MWGCFWPKSDTYLNYEYAGAYRQKYTWEYTHICLQVGGKCV